MVQPLSLALRTETSSAHEDAEGSTCVEEVLLAHHDVRYLGDLSGGQIIARMVQRPDRVDAAGLNFPAIGGPA